MRKMSLPKFRIPARFRGMEANMWAEFMDLAEKNKAVNLGQGFPDFPPPQHVVEALAQTAVTDNVLVHQYARAYGHPRLVHALSKLYSPLIGHHIDAMNDILVTSGAADALFCAIYGHVEQGDEVIIIEPFFDAYEPLVRSAGGTPVFIPLRAPNHQAGSADDWVLDEQELSSKFNANTKAIIINTPHNPLGKVFSRRELELVRELCLKWDVVCIMDEVYEWLVFEPSQHVRMASLPDMWDRTITICSSGKTFSITGWKIGFAYGPNHLIQNLRTVHQNTVYSCNKPLQEAIARAYELELERFGTEESYFKNFSRLVERKRDFLVKSLEAASFRPIVPSGGYFLIADWTALEHSIDLSPYRKDECKDYCFVKWMSDNMKIQSIPTTPFYSSEHKPMSENYIRFCFVKDERVLEKTDEILRRRIEKAGDR